MDPTEQAFREWMNNLVEEIADNAVPKARVYGTSELSNLGATLHQVRNTNNPTPPSTDRRNLQDALWFYTAGKLARWTAAVRREEQPDRDTVYDLLVYALMWLKVEETGEWWPDVPSQENEIATSEHTDEAKDPSYQTGDRIPGVMARPALNTLPVYSAVAPDLDLFDLVWVKTGHDTWYRTGIMGPLSTSQVVEYLSDCGIHILYTP